MRSICTDQVKLAVMVNPKFLKLLALETSVLLTETDIEDILHDFLSLPIINDRVLFKLSVSLFSFNQIVNLSKSSLRFFSRSLTSEA